MSAQSSSEDPVAAKTDDGLWNDHITARNYADGADKYQNAILEQYKIYVEMADRISSRRSLTNTFFLTLNSGVLTASALFWQRQPSGGTRLRFVVPLAVVLLVLLVLCAAWFWIVRSYRLLNGAKYSIVGLLEQRLPASPYWSAEWRALGEGKDWRKYLPLTHLEQWVPITFAVVYLVGFVVLILEP